MDASHAKGSSAASAAPAGTSSSAPVSAAAPLNGAQSNGMQSSGMQWKQGAHGGRASKVPPPPEPATELVEPEGLNAAAVERQSFAVPAGRVTLPGIAASTFSLPNSTAGASPPAPGHSEVVGTSTQGEASRHASTGVQPSPATASVAAVSGGLTKEQRIRAANWEFTQQVSDTLNLPIRVLIEQRDRALSELATVQERADGERQKLVEEHERFVSYLMEEQLAAHRHQREQLKAAQEELQRTKTLAHQPIGVAETTDSSQALVEALAQVDKLRAELESAFTEVDETRADAARLQEERDEAIRANDDVRLELQGEIDAARDETFEVQSKLDQALRELDEARDEARDEALRLNEELDELHRQLDERNADVRRLRQRVETMTDEVKHSRPPPPAASTELDRARQEVKLLRLQLIDAKRELSRQGSLEGTRGRLRTAPTGRGTTSAGEGSAQVQQTPAARPDETEMRGSGESTGNEAEDTSTG